MFISFKIKIKAPSGFDDIFVHFACLSHLHSLNPLREVVTWNDGF